jgi:hypothetical protein
MRMWNTSSLFAVVYDKNKKAFRLSLFRIRAQIFIGEKQLFSSLPWFILEGM